MAKKLTLKKIASAFNVSIATVSKALADSYDISEETKLKIQLYAKKHHYKKNTFALNLKNKTTKTIGIIIPDILNNFFAKAFIGVEKIARQNGYQLVACISNESLNNEINAVDNLMKNPLDGLILSLSEETQVKKDYQHLKMVMDNGIPIALFDRITDQIQCDKIVVDDFQGAYNATQHLILGKCKKIALISTLDNLNIGKLRINGYTKALTDNNIDLNKQLILKIDKSEDFETSINTFLNNHSDLDGILALEEFSAVHILKIAKKKGYKIPDDLSIISFVNGLLSKFSSPSLTTVSQHGEYIGRTIAEILIARLENKGHSKPFVTKVVKTNLILGKSTKEI